MAPSVPDAFSALSEADRTFALKRLQVIRPFLEDGIPLSQIARDRGMQLRTAQRWVRRYRMHGIAGLARRGRKDKDAPRRAVSLR